MWWPGRIRAGAGLSRYVGKFSKSVSFGRALSSGATEKQCSLSVISGSSLIMRGRVEGEVVLLSVFLAVVPEIPDPSLLMLQLFPSIYFSFKCQSCGIPCL